MVYSFLAPVEAVEILPPGTVRERRGSLIRDLRDKNFQGKLLWCFEESMQAGLVCGFFL